MVINMKKLFVDFTPQEKVILTGEPSRHIAKSLRMKKGDMLTLAHNGENYGCMIERVTPDTVELSVCYRQADHAEPTVAVTLYQAVPKGDKMEDIVQKCTELGITKIVPVLTNRCVSRPDEKSMAKKLLRYQKIALESAQQSGRGIIPEICPFLNFEKAVRGDSSELKILFYEGGGAGLKNIIYPEVRSVSVYIGPEGGFEKNEVETVLSSGAVQATLGKRILRTQTAPVAALTAIMLLTGNMD